MRYYLQNARDPISSLTHLLGAGAALGGTVLLTAASALLSLGTVALCSCLVFGLSMVALYSASAAYHYSKGSPQKILRLRKLDHSMIYVLIAGTYTPILLLAVGGKRGAVFTGVIWGLALAGICVKLCWLSAPRWLSTAIYLLMGWAIVFDVPALRALDPVTMALVAAGGAAYSVGAVIYILKKPNLGKALGFHELFHLLILLGSFFHFLAVFLFLFR